MRVAHTPGGGFSAAFTIVCGEQGKRWPELGTLSPTSKLFVPAGTVLESGDRDFSGAFGRLDGLSTLPPQTTTTTVFSLSLRLNLRVLLREHPRGRTQGRSAFESPDEPPGFPASVLCSLGWSRTTRPLLCTAVAPRAKWPARPRIVSTHVNPPGVSPKAGEGLSPGRTDRVQCHPYARRRRSAHRQPGDHGLASGAAARAHGHAERGRAQDDDSDSVQLSLRGRRRPAEHHGDRSRPGASAPAARSR